MTKLMKKALARLAEMPEDEQDALAEILLEEIASDRRWQQSFDASREILETLADQALAENKAGKALPLDEKTFDKHE